MKKSLVLLITLCLLFVMSPLSAGAEEGNVGFNVTAGYYGPEDGDLDNGFALGVGFSYPLQERRWLELNLEFITCDIANTVNEADLTKAHLTYFLHPRERKATTTGLTSDMYFGGGVSMVSVDYPAALAAAGKDSPDSYGFHLTAGLMLNDRVNFELRYEIVDDEDLGAGNGVMEMGGITGTFKVAF